MSDLERAKLIPVSGTNDTPDLQNAVDVQFNPVTLKVSLSNTLKANTGNSNSRATQFVDKSSSTLTVELVFDTTYIEAASSASPSGEQSSSASQSSSRNPIEQGSDVRLQTRKIADKFIKPVESGNKMQAPSRVLFQWGSFEFIGMVSSYDETLDFFSPKGRPLRATVALKLNEDRYQFRSNDDADKDMAQTPTAAFTGNGADDPGGGSDAGNGAGAPNQSVSPVPGGSDGPGSWRDNAMFNGIESPRLPSASTLALPGVSLGASAGFGISGGIGISGGVDVRVSTHVNLGASMGVSTALGNGAGGSDRAGSTASAAASTAQPAPAPAFKYGNSGVLGTGVPGAFSPRPAATLKASALQAGALTLRAPATAPSASGQSVAGTPAGAPPRQTSRPERRQPTGVSVTQLLKSVADDGVGFD